AGDARRGAGRDSRPLAGDGWPGPDGWADAGGLALWRWHRVAVLRRRRAGPAGAAGGPATHRKSLADTSRRDWYIAIRARGCYSRLTHINCRGCLSRKGIAQWLRRWRP